MSLFSNCARSITPAVRALQGLRVSLGGGTQGSYGRYRTRVISDTMITVRVCGGGGDPNGSDHQEDADSDSALDDPLGFGTTGR